MKYGTIAMMMAMSALITAGLPVMAQEAPAIQPDSPPPIMAIVPVDDSEVTGAQAIAHTLADCAAMYKASAQLQAEILNQPEEAKKVDGFADMNRQAAVLYARDIDGVADPHKYIEDRIKGMIPGFKITISNQSEQSARDIEEQTKRCVDIEDFRAAAFKQPDTGAVDPNVLPSATVTEGKPAEDSNAQAQDR